jgi:hypothetical protein
MILIYVILSIEVWDSYPMYMSTDELGTIVGAVELAGLDWSNDIKNSGYYGFVYYSLFFFVFKITDDPIIIYRNYYFNNNVATEWI